MMSVEFLYRKFLECTKVVTDTRKIVEGGIFFALKGGQFDGNEYAEKALSEGCKYAVVDDKRFIGVENFIFVDDVLSSLQELAKYHRNTLNIPIIGITGTNGKTTTKELLRAVLSKSFNVTATAGNLNNHIGVPLTLLEINSLVEIGIVEMGANHGGEIAFLCSIASPDFVLVTNMGKAHLEGFGSYEGVIAAKSEMYNYCKVNSKKAFVNGDDQLLVKQSALCERIVYSSVVAEDVLVVGTNEGAHPFMQFSWNKRSICKSNLLGNYNFHNALAAVCVGLYFGIPDVVIHEAIEGYYPNNNRSQLIETARNRVLMDAYNSNPSSIQVALDNFQKMNAENKCVVVGEMLELGDRSVEEHQQVLSQLGDMKLKQVFLVGESFKKIEFSSLYRWFKNVDDLCLYLKEIHLSDMDILVKGSRGNKLEKVIDVL